MADEELTTAPDVDSMSDAQLTEAMDKMRSGEDVSNRAEPIAAEPATDELDDDHDIDAPDPVDDAGKPAKQDNVPFGRYERERQRRKETESRVAALEAQNTAREQRLLEIMESMKPKQAEPEPEYIPDPNIDPVGGVAYTAKQIEEIRKRLDERDRGEQQSRAEQETYSRSLQEYNTAVSQDGTVKDAYEAVYNSYVEEGKTYGLDGAELKNWLDQTEKNAMYFAVQNKIPLNTYIKGLAKARGWSGAQAAPKPNPVLEVPSAQDGGLDAIRRASASLTPTGGSPARTGQPSPQELLDMSPKQFEEWRSKNELGVAFRG